LRHADEPMPVKSPRGGYSGCARMSLLPTRAN
jgi:hypothetical protein